ncbi:MAG: hypothetical protein II828_01100 [Clostridia bacterium]|nr:hypothetical protein [Clostridia bacterium]MBQ4396098.1 hypothetical protein [Clostridia bacterium]
MLKKRITYTDYDGVERTEDFYFNLSKSELAEMELMTVGSFTNALQKMVDAKDISDLARTFKEILLRAYGEKSPDGKRFMKSPDISLAFSQTPAYDKLFMELFTDADKMIAFINGIIPTEVSPTGIVPRK